MEENSEGVKKTSHYDAMVYSDAQTNQQEFLRKLENSKRNHSCRVSARRPPGRENEMRTEAGSVLLESLFVRLRASPWEKMKPARKPKERRAAEGASAKRSAALQRKQSPLQRGKWNKLLQNGNDAELFLNFVL